MNYTTLLFVVFFALNAIASDATSNEESSSVQRGWLGLSLDYSSIADGSTMIMGVRGGWIINDWFTAGGFASTVASDVRLERQGNISWLDYDAIGLMGEGRILRQGGFMVLVPVVLGAGHVNTVEPGREDSRSASAFGMGEAGVAVSYMIFRSMQASVGGGYRQFVGISGMSLSNDDFNTPYAQLILRWGAF